MTVPADYCFSAEEKGSYRVGDSLIFRNFHTPDLKLLRLDNLRLEGPKGSRLLDGFESPKTWHSDGGPSQSETRIEPRSHRGRVFAAGELEHFRRAVLHPQVRGDNRPQHHLPPSRLRHGQTQLRYDGQHPHCNLRGLFEHWIDLGDRPLHCKVARVAVQQLGGDAWGRVEFADYINSGNTLQRKVVLTREGRW